MADDDLGFAVEVTLPGRYWGAELYVTVPGGSSDPEALARSNAARQLAELRAYLPDADLQVAAVRRVR